MAPRPAAAPDAAAAAAAPAAAAASFWLGSEQPPPDIVLWLDSGVRELWAQHVPEQDVPEAECEAACAPCVEEVPASAPDPEESAAA